MSRRPVESFEVICDWPDCGERYEEGDYSIFGPDWAVEDMMRDSDWLVSRDETQHYCRKHRCAWASDHEDGEPFPAEPFLLIHDGDTDDADDDGKVTRRRGARDLPRPPRRRVGERL
jgi:hypothetical protein